MSVICIVKFSNVQASCLGICTVDITQLYITQDTSEVIFKFVIVQSGSTLHVASIIKSHVQLIVYCAHCANGSVVSTANHCKVDATIFNMGSMFAAAVENTFELSVTKLGLLVEAFSDVIFVQTL